MHTSPRMPTGGIVQMRPSGDHMISVLLMQIHISGITRADLSAISQAGRWGKPQEAITRYGLSSAGAITRCEEEKRSGLVGGMGPPQQIPSFLS